MKKGLKLDDGKLRYDLLPFEQLEEIVKVLTYGANKYAPNNWKLVQEPIDRYKATTLRHLSAYMQGEELDQESGLPHLAHAGTNILFLLSFEKDKIKFEVDEYLEYCKIVAESHGDLE